MACEQYRFPLLDMTVFIKHRDSTLFLKFGESGPLSFQARNNTVAPLWIDTPIKVSIPTLKCPD